MDGLVRSLAIGLSWKLDNKGLIKANEQTDGLINNANSAENEMNQLGRAGNTAGSKIGRAFDAASKKISSGLGILADYRYELAATAAAGTFGIFKLASMAGDAQEELNAMGILFGDYTSEAVQWAENYSNQINRSKNDTIGWLNAFQGTLVPLGMAREQATSLSKELVQTTSDLGSLYNVKTNRAIEAMTSALIGNHEAARILKVQLAEGNLNARAMAMGYEENFAQLDPLVKLEVRYQEILAQSEVAMGNAAETSDDYNNLILGFKGNLRDLGITMGTAYIPSIEDGLRVTNDFLSTLVESEWTKPIARVLALGTAFSGLAAGIGITYALAGAIGIGAAPLAGIMLGIGALILIVEDLWTGFQGGESIIFNIVDWFGKVTGQSDKLSNAIDWLGDKFELMKEDLSLLASGLIDTFSGFGEFIVGVLSFDKEKINNGFVTFFNGIGNLFLGFGSSLLHTSAAIGEGVSKSIIWGIKSLTTGLVNVGYNILQSIWYGIETGWGEFREWWDDITDLSFDKEKITNGFETMVNGLGDLVLGFGYSLFHTSAFIGEGVANTMIWALKSIGFGVIKIGEKLINSFLFGIEIGWNNLVDWIDEKTGIQLPKIDMPEINILGTVQSAWNVMVDWWEDVSTLSFDFEMPNIGGFIDEQVQKLPDWSKKLLGIENEVVEKESKEIQNNNSTNINNTEVNENITINVDGSKDPKEVSRLIDQKLKTRERILAGEVGVNL